MRFSRRRLRKRKQLFELVVFQVPGFRQATFLLVPLLRLVPRFFTAQARQTAEKSNVFFVFWAAILLEPLCSAVCGVPLLRARSGPGPNFAGDRLAERDELVSGEKVHDQLLCDGLSGVPLMRAGGTDDSAGTPCWSPSALGVADMNGELLAAASVSGCVQQHSALQVSSSAR